jgi:hypothetical protein
LEKDVSEERRNETNRDVKTRDIGPCPNTAMARSRRAAGPVSAASGDHGEADHQPDAQEQGGGRSDKKLGTPSRRTATSVTVELTRFGTEATLTYATPSHEQRKPTKFEKKALRVRCSMRVWCG